MTSLNLRSSGVFFRWISSQQCWRKVSSVTDLRVAVRSQSDDPAGVERRKLWVTPGGITGRWFLGERTMRNERVALRAA